MLKIVKLEIIAPQKNLAVQLMEIVILKFSNILEKIAQKKTDYLIVNVT